MNPLDPSPKSSEASILLAACNALGLINEALGLDPDEGAAGPILEAIRELQERAASRSRADLQGLRRALLTPVEIPRDAAGMLDHPSFPVFDEDVNMRLLLKAFGLEASFVPMEHDAPDLMEDYDGFCSGWTPTPPSGAGWLLISIYDTEDGPCALYVRELAIRHSWGHHVWKDAAGRSEWDAALAICDRRDVDEALRSLIEEPTGDNATSAVRAVLRQVASQQAAELEAKDEEIGRLKASYKTLSRILQDQIVANQSAWIEWKHGAGAEAAMSWVHHGLAGPGQIPDTTQPYGKEPQAWFDANRAEPFPQCFCGRPSNTAWMGQGFCSKSHYLEGKARAFNHAAWSAKGTPA